MEKSTISRWYIYIHISLTDYQTPPETERILWRVAAIFLHGSLVHCPRTKVSTMGILLDFLSSWYRQRRMGVRRAFECKRLPLLRNDLSGIAVPLRSVEFPIDVMSWNGFFKRMTMSVATQDVSARAHTHTHTQFLSSDASQLLICCRLLVWVHREAGMKDSAVPSKWIPLLSLFDSFYDRLNVG